MVFDRLTQGNKVRKGFDTHTGRDIEIIKLKDKTKISYQSSGEEALIDLYNTPTWMKERPIQLRKDGLRK